MDLCPKHVGQITDKQKDGELTEAYYSFKRSQGFTEREIRAKAKALEGVLIPQTEEDNTGMLGVAGFTSVKRIFQNMCFQGYLAKK